MEHLAFAQLTRTGRWTGEAWSALPDAPQIVEPERPSVAEPVRARAAHMLFRLANAIEPTPSSTI